MNTNAQLVDINSNVEQYKHSMQQIANEYNVHVDLVHTNDGWYLTACPFSKKITNTPQDIENEIKANKNLFTVNEFAININDHDFVFVAEHLMDYCMKTEFIHTIFTEFEVEIPDKVRESELYALIRFNHGRFDTNMPYEVQNDYSVGLNKYFEKEGKGGFFHKKWKEFYRSERYDDTASGLTNFMNFLKKTDNEVDIEVLLRNSDNVSTIEMSASEYEEFAKRIQRIYPDVKISKGEKTVVDYGEIKIPDELKGIVENPWEGRQSRWEFQEVHYRTADKAKVAHVYNGIRLQYANDEPLEKLQSRGPVSVTPVPSMDFMNFVSLAKNNNLPFHIDMNEMATSDLDKIYVAYNTYNQEKMEGILYQMVYGKAYNYHAINENQTKAIQNTLNQRLEDAQQYRLGQASSYTESGNRNKEEVR